MKDTIDIAQMIERVRPFRRRRRRDALVIAMLKLQVRDHEEIGRLRESQLQRQEYLIEELKARYALAQLEKDAPR